MKEYFFSHFVNEGTEVHLGHVRSHSEATDLFIPVPHWDSNKRASYPAPIVHHVCKCEALVIIHYLPDGHKYSFTT